MNYSYVSGYFKALVDVKNYFDSHSDMLKCLRMYNSKKIPLLLQAFIDNSDRMMVEGDAIELKLLNEGKVILDEN